MCVYFYFYWTHIFAVLRFGEMNEVVVVHVLSVEQVTVLSLTQIVWIDAVCS